MVSTETIAAFKVMAADARKRQMLVKDPTCMGGLILVLSNADQTIVSSALETLLMLAEDVETQPAVSTCLGIMTQLETILGRFSSDKQVRLLAEKLYRLLTENDASVPTPLKDTSNTQRSRAPGSKSRSLVGGTRSTKSVVLQIRGAQDQADGELCIRLLLRVKGVVSVTFDAGKRRCLLRTKPETKPETLVRAILKSMTMTAQQVIRNEKGDESLVSFNVSGYHVGEEGTVPGRGKENDMDLPSYLSDDEDEKPAREEDKSALAKKGHTDKTSGWLNAAASFFTSSFYW